MKKQMHAREKAVRNAHILVDLLLRAMCESLQNPERISSDMWERLFGPKQSMVANAQKLVATLADLPEDGLRDEGKRGAFQPLTPTEMRLLKQWLDDAMEAGTVD